MPPPTKLTRLCVCLVAAACAPAQQVITTIAGTDWLFPADGRPALQAPLGSNFYTAVTVDPQGNFYVADPDNIMVMKVSQDGVLKVIAGNGIPGISGDGGPGVNASLGAPAGLAFDASGNLYIADFFHVIRKLTPAGIISTIAGTGDAGQSGDGGPATAATISPHGIAVSASGDIYFADDSNHKVRKITPGGIISTVAGTGVADYTGDGGPATSAALNTPTGVAIDATGNLYIADNGNLAIRKVTPAGIITTFAGGGFETDDGVAPLNAAIIPLSVSVSPTGDVYVADFLTYRVRKISGGKITTVAGTGDAGFSGDGGPATAAALNSPSSAAITADGIVYIADSGNSRIRKVTADGRISTVAGNAQFRTGGDGGPAISAVMYLPSGVAADKSGNLYISEQSKNRVRKVSRDGTISLFAGTGEPGRTGDGGPATRATLDGPAGLAADAQGNVYIADQVNSVIRKVTPAGFITNFAGTGRFEFNGDNKPPSAAALFGPAAVAVDATGAVYVSDTYNHRIRKIPAGGNIVTIAGSGQKGFSGDNGPASGASLNGPAGLAVDSALNVYFVDAGNQRVRKITPSGVIATIAGTGTPGFSGDGGPATSAMLKNPASVAVDASGNLYIADQRNHRIRRVTPDGIISTFAGSRFAGFTGDGGPATAATLAGPSDVSLDAAGNVLIADLVNHRVRAVLNGPQNFRISSDSLVFTGPSAGAVTNEQRLALQPSLSGLPFVVEAPGVPWITVTPSSGFMPAVLQIAADPSTQSGGTYSTTLTIASPVALPARQTVNVKFVVSPAAPAKLETKPASLSFTTTQGGQPVAQALTISNSGGGLLSFSASTSSPASWLTLSATSGQATPQKAAAINVTVNPAGLAPGTYSAQVAIAAAQGENSSAV